ncbi:MAG: hypothetical protein O3C10_08105 [Chloroflexi bacterium]|nr:hypothetical protein [Chloroflexota bacterium]
MASKSIESVVAKAVDSLMALPGVVGVGIGEHGGEPCIRVMVDTATPTIRAGIPDQLSGYPVIVDETGPIKAFQAG